MSKPKYVHGYSDREALRLNDQASTPQLVEGFIKNTFTAMIEGVGDEAVQKGLLDEGNFKRGIKDLYRTAEPDGVFSYTFFKGFGTKEL